MVFGDAVSTLDMVVWTWNYDSGSITWSLSTLKAINLVKWRLSACSFMWWCQIIDWLSFETRPSSPRSFSMTCVKFLLFSVLSQLKRKTSRTSQKLLKTKYGPRRRKKNNCEILLKVVTSRLLLKMDLPHQMKSESFYHHLDNNNSNNSLTLQASSPFSQTHSLKDGGLVGPLPKIFVMRGLIDLRFRLNFNWTSNFHLILITWQLSCYHGGQGL